MPDLVRLDRKIQLGRGKAARKAGGQLYNFYRLDSKTNVGVTSNAPFLQNYRVRLTRTTSKKIIENTTFDLLTYEAECNNLPLQLMDTFIEHGYRAMAQGVYVIAQMRPTKPTVAVRCEANVSLSAIYPSAGAASQQPASGNVPILSSQGWSGVWKENEQILTLVNGVYSFRGVGDPYWQQEDAAPAQLQVGLQPTARIRDGNALGVPTEQYREPFVAFIPITPGVFLEEVKVRINVGNATSDRYEITKYFSSDLTGLAGQICMCEKLPF